MSESNRTSEELYENLKSLTSENLRLVMENIRLNDENLSLKKEVEKWKEAHSNTGWQMETRRF